MNVETFLLDKKTHGRKLIGSTIGAMTVMAR